MNIQLFNSRCIALGRILRRRRTVLGILGLAIIIASTFFIQTTDNYVEDGGKAWKYLYHIDNGVGLTNDSANIPWKSWQEWILSDPFYRDYYGVVMDVTLQPNEELVINMFDAVGLTEQFSGKRTEYLDTVGDHFMVGPREDWSYCKWSPDSCIQYNLVNSTYAEIPLTDTRYILGISAWYTQPSSVRYPLLRITGLGSIQYAAEHYSRFEFIDDSMWAQPTIIITNLAPADVRLLLEPVVRYQVQIAYLGTVRQSAVVSGGGPWVVHVQYTQSYSYLLFGVGYHSSTRYAEDITTGQKVGLS